MYDTYCKGIWSGKNTSLNNQSALQSATKRTFLEIGWFEIGVGLGQAGEESSTIEEVEWRKSGETCCSVKIDATVLYQRSE